MSLVTHKAAKKSRKRSRRTPLASAALLGIGLLVAGSAYAAVDSVTAAAEQSTAVDLNSAETIAAGEALFNANCATCHGMNAVGTVNGPSLVGVGAASVDFQVGTGRMPMQANGPQAPAKKVQFDEAQTHQIAAYVASLAPGPAIPDREWLTESEADLANGAEIFRINCAMCHNVAAAGGALTEGKFAPQLQTVDPVHLYEAMVTGPQNMPVFNDANLSPEDKRDIIASIRWMTENTSSIGGYNLGSIGPVAEGLFIWIFGIGGAVAAAIWLTSRPN